ncbi:two-component regulator propeller domain-containing protein [Dyella sp. KRB-257]|uniref:hybrid sensor histidine kinase/response regulator n=1 Tax=Dyella sp. KRB-257 TaxID=3400915 RepID=UPI003C07B04A
MVSWVLGLMLAFATPSASGNAAPAAPAASPAQAAQPLATPQFRRYGLADGLPGAMVYAVVQDRQGAMWFGTTGGIGRYDGVGFTVFRHDVDDPHSLPNNQVYTLYVDRRGRLWAGGVSGGLSRYEPASGGFTHWQHDEADPASLAQDEVWSIAQTPDGQLWVATQGGLDRMRADDSGFEHAIDTTLPPQLSPRGFGPTRALLAEDDGRLWIGSERGIYLRRPDGALRRVPVDPSFKGDLSRIWRIEGGGDEVRVSTSSGVLRIGADGVARPVSARLDGLRSMSSRRDARGRLWVGTQEGAWLDDGSENGRMFTGHSLLPGGLPADGIWQITRDREGGLWFAVADGGAAYLGPGWDGFSRMTHVPDDPTSLATTAAEVVVPSRDGRLWVGEVGGIDKLDPATGAVEHVVAHMPESVISMAEDPQHRLWAAGQGALYVVDGGRVQPLDTAPAGLTRPTRLVYSDDGHVYVAAWGEGIFAIDTQTRQVQPLPMPDVAAARNVSVLATHDGEPWYASAAGLMRLDRASHRMVFVAGVPQRFVMAIAFDRSGFWVAWENGLEHYRYADGRAASDRAVAVPAGWQSRDILGMRTDREDRLWLFAAQGLWRFDPASGAFTRFGPQDGLLQGEFNNDRTAMLANGMIYGATKGGVVGFSPERLAARSRQAVAPTVFLSAIGVRRRGVAHALPVDGRALSLGWRDRDLRVVARAASFVNPDGNRFRFRLDGFDTDWVDVGPHGEREFAGLGAGDYTLHVMAAAPGGAWGTLAAPLAIHVDAPPWTRWWAWLAYAAAAAALAATLALAWRRRVAQRHRIQLAEQQRHLAEQANAAKTQFLATLSHEIRTPMTGVMGMAELLLATPLRPDQSDYAQAMQRSGAMLLKLLNDALDLARIEAGRFVLEPAPFDPRQLLDDVTRLVAGQARSKGIAFSLELAPDLPTSLLGDALRIEQILLNLATNAVKFTERGQVTLGARRSADGVVFSVADTGPGIPEASQSRLFQRFEQEDGPQRRAGSGLGLAICRELVTLMGGSIELESRLAHGSTFRVRLPLPEAAEEPAASPAPLSERGRMPSCRVLLVEDDAIVAAVLRGLLDAQGHRVTHVAHGLGALAELSNARFDVMLLDLDLPGVDGFQLARMIRQREGVGERLPIVAITARSGGDEEAWARAAGMDGFVRKPVSGAQLADAIEAVLVQAPREEDTADEAG